MAKKFRSEMPGKHAGEWNFKFAAEAAALETRMLGEDLTIAELAKMCHVAKATLTRFLQTGVHNKAYAELKSRHLL